MQTHLIILLSIICSGLCHRRRFCRQLCLDTIRRLVGKVGMDGTDCTDFAADCRVGMDGRDCIDFAVDCSFVLEGKLAFVLLPEAVLAWYLPILRAVLESARLELQVGCRGGYPLPAGNCRDRTIAVRQVEWMYHRPDLLDFRHPGGMRKDPCEFQEARRLQRLVPGKLRIFR